MNSVAFLDYQHYYVDQKNDTGAFSSEARQWGYAIALPIVGLLILYVFLALGGAFALLGPWAIFIATRLITSHWDEKVCKIESTGITKSQIL
jgi:hypothetical protein